MTILRAGPWGNLTSAHEDVPADVSVPLGIYPVNCALNDWPNQAWGAVYERFGAFIPDFYEYGTVALDESLSVDSDVGHISMQFCYQATQDFDIDINWLITATGTFLPDLSWSYGTIEGSSDSFFNTPADSGTETVTLPASTFGVFGTTLGIGSTDIETIEMSLS